MASAALGGIAYLADPYCSPKYSIDMDMLTRAAGFGYLGSTTTSVAHASFTFLLFALEGSIMAPAFNSGFGLPLALGYIPSSLIVIPRPCSG